VLLSFPMGSQSDSDCRAADARWILGERYDRRLRSNSGEPQAESTRISLQDNQRLDKPNTLKNRYRQRPRIFIRPRISAVWRRRAARVFIGSVHRRHFWYLFFDRSCEPDHGVVGTADRRG